MNKQVMAFQFYLLIVYLVSVAVVYCVPLSNSVHSRPPAYRLSPPSSVINLPPFYGRYPRRSVINMPPVYGRYPPSSAINLPTVCGRSPPRSLKKLHPVYRRSPPSSGIYLLNLNLTEIVVNFKYVEVERVGNDGPGVNTSSLDGGGQNRSNGGGVMSWNTSVVVAVSVGGVSAVFFTCSLLGVCLYKLGKRKGASHVKPSSDSTSDADEVTNMIDGYGLMSIQELENATDNFSPDNILGRGGFGTVYKGELHDGTKVAVKRMESGVMSRKVLEQFKSEIAVLTKVGHRHLVKLLGYCLDGNERILVYEYMPQGTLGRFLFNWKQEGLKPLKWTQRLTIGLDVARGIEYLHGLAHHSYIHRDLKPSNILLADDLRAKVADFGLVRPAPHGEYSFVSRFAGTFGYVAPEYAGSGQVNQKVDVYSFGVILMVLITGRRALNATQGKESVTLVQWFLRMHKVKATFQRAIDPNLELDEEALAVVSTVAELAVHCCASEPHRRPNMNHVVRVLSSIAEPWNPSESEFGSDSSDSCKIDINEEALPGVVEPAVHNCAFEPRQSPDKSLAVGVISPPAETWKPSGHHPDDDSDADDSHEIEPLRHRIRRTSAVKTQSHYPRMDGHCKQLRLEHVPDEVTQSYKNALNSKNMNPMDPWRMSWYESRSGSGSCIWMMFPDVFQVHMVILFCYDLETLARKVLGFRMKQYEYGRYEATQALEKTLDSSDMNKMDPLMMPLSGGGSCNWRCIPLMVPSIFQVYMVILFGLKPSEHVTLARRVIPLGWKPSEHSPDDNSDTGDTQETEIDEETPDPGSRLNLSLMTDFF